MLIGAIAPIIFTLSSTQDHFGLMEGKLSPQHLGEALIKLHSHQASYPRLSQHHNPSRRLFRETFHNLLSAALDN